jgi:hypothetical protein
MNFSGGVIGSLSPLNTTPSADSPALLSPLTMAKLPPVPPPITALLPPQPSAGAFRFNSLSHSAEFVVGHGAGLSFGIGLAAPKSQISDYDWDHLTKLTKDSLANASEALTKVQELEQQTP